MTTYGSDVATKVVLQWNGTSWVSVPLGGVPQNVVYDSVSCVGRSCQMVGSDEAGTIESAMALNGGTWTIENMPAVAPVSGLAGVSCVTTSFCMAVGYQGYDPSTNVTRNLVETWNGTTWSLVSVPDASTVGDGLDAVNCFGLNSCVAGGTAWYNDPSPFGVAEALTWNGSNWSAADLSQVPGATYSAIDGVACVPNAACFGVGSADTATGMIADSSIVRPGYTEAASDGGLFSFGAPLYGSMGGLPLNKAVDGLAVTPDGGGYWEAAADGGVFAFGDAFYGSLGAKQIISPVAGIAAAADGGGYYEVASDGGIFAFGDANLFGSMSGHPLNQPVVGMTLTPDGQGYWEVGADGGIFAFGDAGFYGSMGGRTLNGPIVGMAATPDGGGYWEVAADGGIFAFCDATFYGSMGGQSLNEPVVAMTADPNGGYYEVAADGGIFAFGGAPFLGSMAGTPLSSPVIGMANKTLTKHVRRWPRH